eukprot:16430460-Heterocapsa_arctica.AAC.1
MKPSVKKSLGQTTILGQSTVVEADKKATAHPDTEPLVFRYCTRAARLNQALGRLCQPGHIAVCRQKLRVPMDTKKRACGKLDNSKWASLASLP